MQAVTHFCVFGHAWKPFSLTPEGGGGACLLGQTQQYLALFGHCDDIAGIGI